MSSTSPSPRPDLPDDPPPLPRTTFALPDVSTALSRPMMFIAAVALAATFVLPPQGLGISSCFFKDLTDLPCMGCGMTRGMTCVSHGEFVNAWRYHPFAFLLWPIGAILTLGAVVPPFGRWLTERFAPRRRRPISTFFWVSAAAFVVYGMIRLFVPALHGYA